ncbi:MAG TPA: ABC transporter permease [Phototrophicaceae bacterium]|nr:ABC transporter permease [Phototrophicaceae bacterium]
MSDATVSPAPVRLTKARQAARSRGLWSDAFRRLTRHKLAMFGLVIILITAIFAAIGPNIVAYTPDKMDMKTRFAPPSAAHLFGTDDFGRDTFTRIVYGARVSLEVGVISVGIAATIGTFLGLLAGYSRRLVDEVIMRSMDVLYAFPAVLLAIAILAALGKGVGNAMIAIGVVYIPIFARITRGEVLSIRNEEYITAARSIGAGDIRILFRHILPNILAPIIVETSLSLAFAILAEASLSFFGLGTQPPDASWGRMLSEGRNYFRQSPWMGIFPGVAIMLVVMGFNFLGDGLRDALDPRLNR